MGGNLGPEVRRIGERLLVLDPSLPHPGRDFWFLWDEATGTPSRFMRADVNRIAMVEQGANAERVLSAYARWLATEKDAWAATLPYRSLSASTRRSPTRPVQRPNSLDRYTASCFRCEADVDSAIDGRCRRCGWVKCRKCLACGCEWNL
jgi:hypothetical protein